MIEAMVHGVHEGDLALGGLNFKPLFFDETGDDKIVFGF